MLRGKKGFVVGVSNAKSLGWHVACAWKKHGAQVAIGCQDERFKNRVETLVASTEGWDLNDTPVLECNLEDESSVEKCKLALGNELHMAMHAVAFAPKACLHGDGKPYGKASGRVGGPFLHTSKEDFLKTMEVSVFSWILLGRALAPLLVTGAERSGKPSSLMTLTFDGSSRVVEGYNIMGPAKGALESCTRYMSHDLGEWNVRVNAISAGPVNTLAARGLPNFNEMKREAQRKAALPNPLSGQDVGEMATFLASDLSASVTGQVLHVDAGASIMT